MDAGGNFNQPKPSTDVLQKFQGQQKWWQTQQAQRGFVHLTGKTDRVTSVAIPLAMATVGGFMAIPRASQPLHRPRQGRPMRGSRRVVVRERF